MQHTPTPPQADPRRIHAGTLSPASLLHQSDERLVSLARAGSERAWTEIMRRYGRQLRAYCARFVGPGRAEDVVQQAFLQAFLALRDGSHREIALRAWLYRIAHNCAIDLLRKGSHECEQLDLEYDGVAQPSTLFEQKEDIKRLVARMRDLPEAQRQALALRELEGRSYEEISAQLGHTGSGVRQLIFRARTTLRNGVGALLPLGLIRDRLSQPVLDGNQIATAAAVSAPASSGGGIEMIGVATLAAVAVLGGGMSGSDGKSRHRGQASPAARIAAPPVSAPAAAPGDQADGGRDGAVGGGRNHTGAPARTTDVNVLGVPAPEPGSPAVTPAGPPPAPVTDEAGKVRQQILAPPAPADSEPVAHGPQDGAPPGTTGPAGPAPASAKPAKPQPARRQPSRPDASKPKPVKSQPATPQPPKHPAGEDQAPQASKPQAPTRKSHRR